MFLHDGHLEALFIDPDQHGKGIGKAFISRAIAAHPELTTDVNEQNPEALAFYEHGRFRPHGNVLHDGQEGLIPSFICGISHLCERRPPSPCCQTQRFSCSCGE